MVVFFFSSHEVACESPPPSNNHLNNFCPPLTLLPLELAAIDSIGVVVVVVIVSGVLPTTFLLSASLANRDVLDIIFTLCAVLSMLQPGIHPS